ncbi:hypothetical protein [Pararobbsia alpina]|uniref:Uncharacterized protein n=1 Tax=Pararobbsia alpina TaxID=621374 RepID=A0A6S7D2V4_9BURK|nr:hypothetical protein [Pararobbsia alpina]CAB3804771.1 hypothetical protein LMG28138_05570 [Pararobbsia alpina]
MQTTSILRHPVFVDGANYNGTPNMVRTPFLLQLEWFEKRGLIPAGRILHGLPHPSGANAERIAYFLGRKARCPFCKN